MSSIARLSLSRSLSFSFRLNLQARMLILLGGFALLLTLAMGAVSLNFIASTLETQMGQQALDVARAVARLPQIREGLEEEDSRKIQPLVEEIRSATGARFIVVGDENGVRYAHPIPDRIGKKMVGGDNARALELGEEYVSTAVGSLGPSVRGKVPVFSEGPDGDQKVIGIISVGYMLNQVDQVVGHYQTGIWWFSAATVLVSLFLAKLISDYFKRAIFGFEPEEIARLYQERNATLQSVREGIIAINPKGDVTTFNEAALKIFGLDPKESMQGRNIREFQANSDLLQVMQTGIPILDKEDIVGGQRVVVNRIPLFQSGTGNNPKNVIGAVSSFRLKDELDRLTDQLNRMQIYADTLRSQAHEYSNKLHTIAGLIQIGAMDQAIELIGQETRDHQTLLHFLLSAVPDPVLSGCILGKYNRARELGLTLEIDPESQMQDLPDDLPRELLVTILANLLDNAMDASLAAGNAKHIRLSMTDLGNDLIFEVEDEGQGVDPAQTEAIFAKGVSSKSGQNHGYGLYLVAQALGRLQGEIALEPLEPRGTRAVVYIPKEAGKTEG